MARLAPGRKSCGRPGDAQMAACAVREIRSEPCLLRRLPFRSEAMNTALVPVKEPVSVSARPVKAKLSVGSANASAALKLKAGTLVAVPVAAAIALAIHFAVRKNDPDPDTGSYGIFLSALLGVALALDIIQFFSTTLRRWMAHMCPIVAGAIGLLCIWEIITSGFRLLPLPYFPSPASVLHVLIFDKDELFKGTWHSLALLLSGYALGAALGIITGICIGWFNRARRSERKTAEQ